MNPELKRQWLAALRSGKYIQTREGAGTPAQPQLLSWRIMSRGQDKAN